MLQEKAGISAIIGVILMVAIVVAIAATVYVYVVSMTGPVNTGQVSTPFTVTGELLSIDNDDGYDMTIGATILEDVRNVSYDDYLLHISLIGRNCTFSFLRYEAFRGYPERVVYTGVILRP